MEALDRAIFVGEGGTTTIEYCHYDYNGHCSFAVANCPCHRDWEASVRETLLKPRDQWDSMERLEVDWHEILEEISACRTQLARNTGISAAVRLLWEQLEEAWHRGHELDLRIAYRPQPNELPTGPEQTVFGWLGVDVEQVPDRQSLTDLETRLITVQLVRLLGKELITSEVWSWEGELRYARLSRHFSCRYRGYRSAEGLYLFCIPGQLHLFEMIDGSLLNS